MKRLAMIAIFLGFFALSSFMGAREARAMEPAGHSFCPDGIESAEELDRKFTASLAVDPTGNRRLEGCYATPLHFLVAFQQADPGAGLTTVSQLPGYARSLVPMEVDRTVEHRTSCIQDRAGGGTVVVMACVTREVREGEVIYGNPETGAKVLWSGCANPGFTPSLEITIVGEDCIEVRFPSMGDAVPVRGAYIGPRMLPGRCHALLLAGEEERRFDYPEECPDVYQRERADRMVTIVCDWSAAEQNSTRIMGQPVQVQNVSFSFRAREEGTNVWYLPPEALEGLPTLCWELPNGQIIALSVGRQSFVDGVAVVTEADVRASVWR